MTFDLVGVQRAAARYGWQPILHESHVEVGIPGVGSLLFANLADGDTYIGFAGHPWHSHGDIQAAIYGSSIAEAPHHILEGLHRHDLVVQRIAYPNGVVDLVIRDVGELPAAEPDGAIVQILYCSAGAM